MIWSRLKLRGAPVILLTAPLLAVIVVPTASADSVVTRSTAPAALVTAALGSCDSHYPDFCLPPSPDVDCGDSVVAGRKNFTALPPDPHGLDSDGDGVACESSAYPRYPSSPAPSASPSPSPSPSPTASPSPSPTASPLPLVPGASPTDSPTAPAEPDPTAQAAPTLSISPTVVTAGQRVSVTYHGTPGATVDVLSKTQPATTYSRITSVVLDANGYGTSSHAPHKNTRIMAMTAGGATSAQPLIQVRSVASLNVRRVSTRTFAFSGTVSPALNNRLVNLYRNGGLVAQGRTNSSGVFTITKTLASGTYNFQAKTPNDTYNLGAASPIRTVRIY